MDNSKTVWSLLFLMSSQCFLLKERTKYSKISKVESGADHAGLCKKSGRIIPYIFLQRGIKKMFLVAFFLSFQKGYMTVVTVVPPPPPKKFKIMIIIIIRNTHSIHKTTNKQVHKLSSYVLSRGRDFITRFV